MALGPPPPPNSRTCSFWCLCCSRSSSFYGCFECWLVSLPFRLFSILDFSASWLLVCFEPSALGLLYFPLVVFLEFPCLWLSYAFSLAVGLSGFPASSLASLLIIRVFHFCIALVNYYTMTRLRYSHMADFLYSHIIELYWDIFLYCCILQLYC